MGPKVSEKEQQAVDLGLMTVDEDGRRRCTHDKPVYVFCIDCYSDLTPEQMRLMGKDRAASLKENRVAKVAAHRGRRCALHDGIKCLCADLEAEARRLHQALCDIQFDLINCSQAAGAGACEHLKDAIRIVTKTLKGD